MHNPNPIDPGRPFQAALLAFLVLTTSALPVLAGNPGNPAALARERCAGCHGEDGNGVATSIPKLAGQQSVYLLREMKDYRDGRRRNDIMTPMLAGLSDAELEGLAQHYAMQKPSPGVVTHPQRLALGKRIYMQGNPDSGVPACEGCHEANGEGAGKFARVAGQHAEYSQEQLRQYASGERSNGVRVMRTIAQRLTEEEKLAVIEYMSSLK